MKSLKVLGLAFALVTVVGFTAAADDVTISCDNPVAHFDRTGCDGTATLYCTGDTAYLDYELSACKYYKLDDGDWTFVSNHVALERGRVYQGTLTNTPDGISHTNFTVDTRGGDINPPPPPPPPQGGGDNPPPPPPPQQGGGDNPPPPPPPPPPTPTCSADVQPSAQSASVAVARVSCSVPMAVVVDVFDGQGNRRCENNQFAALPDTMGVACSFQRDPLHMMNYQVTVNTINGDHMTTQNGVLYKAPTFNYPPQGRFTSNLHQTPAAQVKKSLFSKGYYWDFSVSAVVSDRDVDSSEGQALIRVDLVDITTGKVLGSQMANSGQTVVFNLEHQQITSRGGHDTGEGLQRGHNVLKLKVYDAYQSNNENAVVWPGQEEIVDINGGA